MKELLQFITVQELFREKRKCKDRDNCYCLSFLWYWDRWIGNGLSFSLVIKWVHTESTKRKVKA